MSVPSDDAYERGAACAIKGCVLEAECWLDGTPYCIIGGHADLLLERLLAIELVPSLRETLPEIPHR